MINLLMGAAAAMLAVAAPSTPPAKGKAATTAQAKTDKNKADDFDFLKVLQMFDKLFPAGPQPTPERLALSRTSVSGLLPDGTYARLVNDVMDTMVDRVMNFSEADFGAKGKDGKPPSTDTLRQAALKDDPHFDERMKIIRRIVGEEMVKIGAIIEPKVREGLARSMARRLDAKQLTDLNAFLATDSGKAYGRENMGMWVDSDVMRSIFASMPELFITLPGVIGRIDKETAHLPKPKKPAKADVKDEAGDDEADGE